MDEGIRRYFDKFVERIWEMAMACWFSCICVTKNVAVASLNPSDESHSKPDTIPIPTNNQRPRQRRRLPKSRRPSVIEMERAIGGGRFRDADPRDLEEDRKTAFDMGLLSFTTKYEGSLMKNLRQTGEWVTDQTESKFQASGKLFLLFTFQWVLPIWVFSFLVASGLIKLPFNTPFLDQLLM